MGCPATASVRVSRVARGKQVTSQSFLVVSWARNSHHRLSLTQKLVAVSSEAELCHELRPRTEEGTRSKFQAGNVHSPTWTLGHFMFPPIPVQTCSPAALSLGIKLRVIPKEQISSPGVSWDPENRAHLKIPFPYASLLLLFRYAAIFSSAATASCRSKTFLYFSSAFSVAILFGNAYSMPSTRW